MFKEGLAVTFDGKNWSVVRGVPDSDGDIVIKRGECERYAKAELVKPISVSASPMPESSKVYIPVDPVSTSTNKSIISNNTLLNTHSQGKQDMSKVSRQVVQVSLLDEDKGLKPELSLVADLGTHIVENGNLDSLKQKILMSPEAKVAEKLKAHNDKRSNEVNLDILNRTGNKAKLQPVEIHELTWSIK